MRRLYDYLVAGGEPPRDVIRFLDRLYVRIGKLSVTGAALATRDRIRPGLKIMTFEKSLTIAFEIRHGKVRIRRVYYRGADFTIRLKISGPDHPK